MRVLLLMLLLSCPLVAGEDAGPAPHVIFRTPDQDTARAIKVLLSSNGIGSSTRDVRSAAREGLREIGRWSVAPLRLTIDRKKRVKGVRVPMNAIMTLARILDPDCLLELRAAAEGDRDKNVRKTACLALGLFGPDPTTVTLLDRLFRAHRDGGEHRRASAIALGKIAGEGVESLLETTSNLPRDDEFLAAAVLLAAAVRTPRARPARYIGHEQEIVRRVAVTCLLIRPTQDPALILDVLKKTARAEDRHIRPLLYHALASIERTEAVRARLMHCATRTRENDDARIAAVVGLAQEWGVTASYKPLRKVWKLLSGRNNKVGAALMLATLQTGDPRAVDDALRVLDTGSNWLRFYAGGSLLYYVSLSRPGRAQPREVERKIFDKIAGLRSGSRDSQVQYIIDMAGALKYESDLEKRAKKAREWFADVPDRNHLHLWDWTREDRAWALINRLIPALFELDDIADKGDPFERTEDNPVGDGAKEKASDQRTISASPEESDLLDFLAEHPYFGPEDLGDR